MITHRHAPNRRILVVEDSPTQAVAVSALLESAHYVVEIARSGEAALNQLAGTAFDLIISDIVMPGMSGYDLARAVKSRDDLRGIPIVLLTSLVDPLDIIRGLECGADNYLTKPYEADQLLARIAGVFDNQTLRRARHGSGPVGITFLGTHFTITSEKEQILDLLLSSFEELVRMNSALRTAEAERARLFELESAARLEAEEARKVAEDANKTKSEFLAMMSHDLRTPLNAIGGYAELLALGVHGPVNEKQLVDLERIRRNQQHLQALVNDVLSFAQIERGDIRLKMLPTNLHRAIRYLGAMIEPQTTSRGQTYQFTTCNPELSVLTDPERLEQIIINLLGNAVKFTPNGGAISLGCGVDPSRPEMARVQVRDTGIGIPAEKLVSIFDPFTQLDIHHNSRDGVGLGLAISRNLARMMDGDITVESTVGVGTVLSVWLPLAPRPDNGTTAEAEPGGLSRQPSAAQSIV